MTFRRILRSILAVIVAMILISALVEGLEFALVSAINGGLTTDPESYYAIRNQTWFLLLKLIYNTAAAIVGGFVVALIAGYAPFRHGIVLAGVQTVAFVYALTQPELRQWTPIWVWIALILLTIGGILIGARIQERRMSAA